MEKNSLHRHGIGKPNEDDGSKSKSFIHAQISTSLFVAKGTREGGFEIIARELLRFNEVLKWDGLS
eukprot:scaffold1659_cov180-Chaetoceros_neogracile.AAC.1